MGQFCNIRDGECRAQEFATRIDEALAILLFVPDVQISTMTLEHGKQAYRALLDVGRALRPEPPSVHG